MSALQRLDVNASLMYHICLVYFWKPVFIIYSQVKIYIWKWQVLYILRASTFEWCAKNSYVKLCLFYIT